MNCRLAVLFAFVFASFSSLWGGELVFLSGSCRNATYGVDGRLKLALLQDDDSLIGYMSISGWLCGSGAVEGTRTGDKVKFRTKDPATGLVIDWQANFAGDQLEGEYFVAANAASSYQREVGEWSVVRQATRMAGSASTERHVQEFLKLQMEMMLNTPVTLADKTVISGAENVFRGAHPAGKGISIEVESVDIDWKAESKTRNLEDVHKFRTTYLLYWQGLLTPTGTTRLRIAYNTVLNAPTSHEILESTGTTRQEFNEMAVGVGFVLGQAAMNSLLK